MRLVNWWRTTAAARTRLEDAAWTYWPAWRWQVRYLALGHAYGCEPPVWRAFFPLALPGLDAVVLPTRLAWWTAFWWRYVAGPLLHAAVRRGLLVLPYDGGCYSEGRWVWDPRRWREQGARYQRRRRGVFT